MEDLAVSQDTPHLWQIQYRLLAVLFKIFKCCVLCKNSVMTALYFVVLNNFSGYVALWRTSARTNLFLQGMRESCIFNWNKFTTTACINFFLFVFWGWLTGWFFYFLIAMRIYWKIRYFFMELTLVFYNIVQCKV